MTWPKHIHLLKGLNFVCALAAIAVVSLFPDKAHGQCTINMSGADLQTIDGFGAFSAWSGPISSEQGSLLFGTGNGQLGMSLFRVYIDETRQDEARSNSKLAHSYGAKVLGSSWSPPNSMKNNNDAIGGSLLPSAYGAFANYLAEAAQEIDLDYVSPQNESDFLPGNYGGCAWSSADIETWCQNNAPTVGKPIVVAESYNFNQALTDPTLNNSKAAKNVAVVAGHLYGASAAVYQNALDRGKPVWMTEHCLEENDFNAAMQTAREISDCMNCHYSAYIWWWINAGITSFINGSIIDTRGYMFGQFSRFIRPGSVRVGATYTPQPGVFITAYRVNGGCTIVALNENTGPVNQQFNIQNGTATRLQGYQTSANQNMADIGSFNVTGGNFSATLPPQSLTTFVQPTVPVIACQPQNTYVYSGANAKFSVTAAGLELNYQWYFNGTTALAGANGPVLTLTAAQASRVGTYSVVVSNEMGSVTSSAARLAICPLVWNTPVTISSATDISTTGTLLYAYSNSGSNATVNGVSFTGVDSTSTWGTGVRLSGFEASITSVFGGGSSAPWSGLGASYQTILQGGAFRWGNGEATVTLNNLVAGHQYQVQVWVNDSRASGGGIRTETVTGANTLAVAFNNTQGDGGLGQYIIGSFTATARTQSFMMNGGSSTPQMNAIQLRDVSGTGNITWGMPKTISGEMDLSTTGVLQYAYSNSGSNTNVNGVNFAGVDSSAAWGTDVTLSGFNASVTTAFAGGSTAPWSSLSTGYQTILQGGAYNASSGAGSVTLNSLAAGRRYQVQFWVNDSRAGGTTTRAETLTGDNNVAVAFNSTQAQDGVGQFAVGTFTAAGTTQSFTINGGTNLPQINAIQVRDITSVSASSLPVTSGLVLHMDASQVTCADGGQLTNWMDSSGVSNHAVRQNGSNTGYPKFIARGVNGLPVVRFNSDNTTGDSFKFPRISNIKTVFWVIKENAGLHDGHFLLGDESAIQFHRGSANDALWSSTYADANIKNGITKLMGNVIDGTVEPLPSESYQLVSLVTTGDVQANQICQDRTSHGSWQGDIAEILIYNRALTDAEEGATGSYLATKYALPTAYSGSKAPAVPTGVLATSTSPGAIRVSWPAVSSAISYNIWCKPSAGGVERVITGVTASPYIITGLAAGISYDCKVATINAVGTSAYSSVSTATALRNSEKDIRTFVFPGQPNTIISENIITVTLPHGTNMNELAPTYTLSPDATGSPISGTPRNFTTPQTYTITAEDSTTRTYTVTVTVAPPPLTYDFNDATLQGWNNRVWNGSVWIDLAANAPTYSGTLLPTSTNNGLFVPGSGAVWVSGNTDYHLNTLWLRSPQFYLNGTGDLTVELAKGIANTTAPANDSAVPFEAVDGGGWKGVALRRVRDGVFVLNKPRNIGNDDNYRTVIFTQAELATLNFSTPYTLELINSDKGNWGWLTMDNVSIPGTAAPVPASAYGVWAAEPARGLTMGVNSGPMDDPDKDGIPNMLEFALGGAPMAFSQSIQPVLSKQAGSWVFEYNRSDASQPVTAQVVEYGNDLTGWTPVTIPATSSGMVKITQGSPSDNVKVTIPLQGSRIFVRLKLSQ